MTLDDRTTLERARKSPELFLKENNIHRTAIDECQEVEDLFRALKEAVRKNKKPGQYMIPLIDEVTPRARAAADSFLKSDGNSKVIFVNRYIRDFRIFNDRVAEVPAAWALLG